MKIKTILALLFCMIPVFLLTESTNQPVESSNPDLTAEVVTTVSETTAVTTETSTETTTTTTKKKVEPPADLVLKCPQTVEACADITLDDFITERNVELKDGSVWLDTAELGSFEVEVPYMYEGAEFSKKLRYRVVDTTEPLILNTGWNTEHKVGTDFDLNEYVGYADNYDAHPVLTYEGEIDPNTLGAYPLVATVTDSSGNSSSWDITISVVGSSMQSPDTIPRVDYGDFITRYDGEDLRFGIDVSAWQSNIDFDAVREAGCSFVIIRVGYFYNRVKLDDYFSRNLKNAKEAGLDVGIYFYTTDRDEDEVREHVRWIAEQLDGENLDLPIAFDWEEFATFQEYGMSIRNLNDVYAAFADEVIRQGYKPMLYSSKNFLNTVWSEKSKQLSPVWLAHYVDETNYEGEYAIWQASAYGHIPGIDGDVDMDIQYKNKKTDYDTDMKGDTAHDGF